MKGMIKAFFKGIILVEKRRRLSQNVRDHRLYRLFIGVFDGPLGWLVLRIVVTQGYGVKDWGGYMAVRSWLGLAQR